VGGERSNVNKKRPAITGRRRSKYTLILNFTRNQIAGDGRKECSDLEIVPFFQAVKGKRGVFFAASRKQGFFDHFFYLPAEG
jgi:hypothetical protein